MYVENYFYLVEGRVFMKLYNYASNEKTFMLAELENENIVNYQVEIINNNQGLFLLPVKERKTDNVVKVEVDITGKISIEEFIKGRLFTADKYLSVVMKICDIYLRCEDYMLKTQNMILNNNTIFMDNNNSEVYMLYLPIKNNALDNNIELLKKYLIEFSKDVSNTLHDNAVITEIMKYLYSPNISVLKLKRYVENLIQRKNADNIVAVPQEKAEEVEKIEKSSIFSRLKGAFKKKYKGDKNSSNKSENKLNVEEGNENIAKKGHLTWSDGSLMENIAIEKDVFLFGRIAGGVDYVINNSAASRVHARIENIDNKFYITDLDSKNGTYLNEARLVAYERYKLENNNVIRLANMNFVFNIK